MLINKVPVMMSATLIHATFSPASKNFLWRRASYVFLFASVVIGCGLHLMGSSGDIWPLKKEWLEAWLIITAFTLLFTVALFEGYRNLNVVIKRHGLVIENDSLIKSALRLRTTSLVLRNFKADFVIRNAEVYYRATGTPRTKLTLMSGYLQMQLDDWRLTALIPKHPMVEQRFTFLGEPAVDIISAFIECGFNVVFYEVDASLFKSNVNRILQIKAVENTEH